MVMIAQQAKAHRIVRGVAIPYPCGNPNLTEDGDQLVRLEIVKTALKAIETNVDCPTEFLPNIEYPKA